MTTNFEIIELTITEEDIEIVNYQAAAESGAKLLKRLDDLLNSYKSGRAIKDGLQVALVGAPNAGKSSLLNALLSEEKAIVSDIPGTTRDVVEASIQRNGLTIHFFDTAGIRDTSDSIEKMGIQRSEQAIAKADLILLLHPADQPLSSLDTQIVEKLPNKNVYLVISKSDLVKQKSEFLDSQSDAIYKFQQKLGIKDKDSREMLFCSSVKSQGLESLTSLIDDYSESLQFEDSGVLQQARHFELLSEVKNFLVKGIELMSSEESAEFISFELHEAIFKIHEVLGKRFDDEVMDRVFKEFCIGK